MGRVKVEGLGYKQERHHPDMDESGLLVVDRLCEIAGEVLGEVVREVVGAMVVLERVAPRRILENIVLRVVLEAVVLRRMLETVVLVVFLSTAVPTQVAVSTQVLSIPRKEWRCPCQKSYAILRETSFAPVFRQTRRLSDSVDCFMDPD